ncbi:hypothetical protein EVAR_69085_1 [Eumeta japonica]|uniref:Uncharacterized protein n=1 Tax=Eumeta variegata TaxID=151549 RepID=A0A4C1ZJ57_EUMVA|nr:hypothetical protein EVAR_69085_1 [Eumeta japonica]
MDVEGCTGAVYGPCCPAAAPLLRWRLTELPLVRYQTVGTTHGQSSPPIFLRKGANFGNFRRLHDIKDDLVNRFPVLSVHRMSRRDGLPLDGTRILEDCRVQKIFSALMRMRPPGIESRPHSKGGPGQCHRCQNTHAAVNCHADPAVSNVWSHIGPKSARSLFGGETLLCKLWPASHGYRDALVPNHARSSLVSSPPAPPCRTSRDLENFRPLTTVQRQLLPLRPAPVLSTNPGMNQPRGRTGTIEEPARRAPRRRLRDRVRGSFSFGDDIQR